MQLNIIVFFMHFCLLYKSWGWEWIFAFPVLEFICYLCKVCGFLDEGDGFVLEKGMSFISGLSVLKDLSRTLRLVINAVCYKDFLLENRTTFLVVEIFL